MSLRQFFKLSANRKAKPYTPNVTTAPPHNLPGRDPEGLPDDTESVEPTTALTQNLPGRDFERVPESSLSGTLGDTLVTYSTHTSGDFKIFPLIICM